MLNHPDLAAARRHTQLLAGADDAVLAWQTIDDSKADPTLARGFHGRLDDVLPRLTAAQRNGCGVYVAVNETDGERRRIENMVAARALFLDLDGSPLPALGDWPVAPDIIVQSSARDSVEKFQCWWAIEPTKEWDRWRRMQMALVQAYGGDPKCTIITQVGRLAGFYHQKDPANPWQVRIVHDSDAEAWQRPTLEHLVGAFGYDLDAITMPVPHRRDIERPPPVHGWDNDIDVAKALLVVADERNWVTTSDGAYSVYKMACWLRDIGISQARATELIEQHVPVLPAAADNDPHYVAGKVRNAFAYAQSDAGVGSYEADRRELMERLVDSDALSAFLAEGDDNE
jgi:hypothetical protein